MHASQHVTNDRQHTFRRSLPAADKRLLAHGGLGKGCSRVACRLLRPHWQDSFGCLHQRAILPMLCKVFGCLSPSTCAIAQLSTHSWRCSTLPPGDSASPHHSDQGRHSAGLHARQGVCRNLKFWSSPASLLQDASHVRHAGKGLRILLAILLSARVLKKHCYSQESPMPPLFF